MRRCIYGVLVAGLLASTGCGGGGGQAKPPPTSAVVRQPSIFRFHFVGTTRLAGDTNAAPWFSMSELPASQTLWRQTLEKLAMAPHRLVRPSMAATNNFAATFEALIADFVRAESFVEATGNSNGIAECVLAARLPAGRAEFWRTNLMDVVETWTGSRSEPLAAGWQLTQHESPNVIRFVRTEDWALIGFGRQQLSLPDEYSLRIKQTGKPVTALEGPWLELVFDGANLVPALSSALGRTGSVETLKTNAPAPLEAPAVEMQLIGRNGGLRLDGTLLFHDTLPRKLDPWQIPTNIIWEPIISFTAARGIAPVFRHIQQALGLRLDQAPDQFFVWAGAHFPVQTWAAASLPQGERYLHDLAPQIINRVNPLLRGPDSGFLGLVTNSSGTASLRWIDVPPFMTPFISTVADSGRTFVTAGTFPMLLIGTNPPPLLYHHLCSQTNLLYYDWEITAEHVRSWRALINVFRHYLEKPRLGTDTASITWINSVSNRLGNTITEITQTDSNRLALVRQGPIGLTGIELMALAHWLESPDFPLSGLTLAPRTNAPTTR